MKPAAKVSHEPLDKLRVSVLSRHEDAAAEWEYLEQYDHDPFSSYAWVSAWYDSQCGKSGATPVIVVGKAANGTPLFLLPLMRERRGWFSVIVWPGGKHSAYQGGLFSPACRAMVTPDNAGRFWKAVFAALPRSDAFLAYGVPAFEVERNSPLMHLPRYDCGCISYRMKLSADWDALYAAKVNSKSRRNDKRCERRLSELGALRFNVPRTRGERHKLLDTLFAQKSAQLAELPVDNCYADQSIREFFEGLIDNCGRRGSPAVMMASIDLDGETIATNLGIIHNSVFHGVVMSMTRDQLTHYGPGRILLRRVIEHLCQLGVREMDFGVGDAPYKHQWRDEISGRFNVLVPFNARGAAFIFGLRIYLNAKDRINRSPVLLRFFSRVRCWVSCSTGSH